MRVLTVLDRLKRKVYCYDVEWLEEERYEDYMVFRGHKLDHCNWLVTDSVPALYVPGMYYSGDSGE